MFAAYDLFISDRGMTPGEFKNGGEQLHINYSLQKFSERVIVASTVKRVCLYGFAEDEQEGFG